ncbi:MAG TPA: hypothetical protein PLY45_01295 [bacterium]|nr:hypothetical protein [bacterium]
MKTRQIITIALFGSAWGMLEATLGGLLHLAFVPFTGTIMASIGFAVLFAAFRSGVGPAGLASVAALAASFKFLGVPLFGLAPFDKTIVNPAVAIASQGLAFAAIFTTGRKPARFGAIAVRMLCAAALYMIAFNLVSVLAFGWPTNHTQALFDAALLQLPLTAFCASLLSAATGRIELPSSARWQATAAVGCAAAAVAATYVI